MSRQWDAKFAGVKHDSEGIEKRRITVFAANREDAIQEVIKQAGLHGLLFVTIDHITRN